jgi:hypothetical protein
LPSCHDPELFQFPNGNGGKCCHQTIKVEKEIDMKKVWTIILNGVQYSDVILEDLEEVQAYTNGLLSKGVEYTAHVEEKLAD